MAQNSDDPFGVPNPVDSSDPFERPVQPDTGVMGAAKQGLVHSVNSIREQVGHGADYLGRVADAASAPDLGDWLHGQAKGLNAEAAANNDASNTLSANDQASTIKRNAYGVADAVGQMGVVGGTGFLAGAAAGGAAGLAFGGVGAIPGAIAGGVLGWTLANVGALTAMAGFGQAGKTADEVEQASLKAGKTPEQAKSDALTAGAETGAATAASQGIINLLGPLGKVVGKAATGTIVKTALEATMKDVAIGTAKASAVGAGANVAGAAATQGIEGQYGVGEGITAQGLGDAAIQGGLVTAAMHGPVAALRARSTAKMSAVLMDPTADVADRQKAAASAALAIGTRDRALAQDFGIYAAIKIAKQEPIDVTGDHIYSTFADDARAQAEKYKQGAMAQGVQSGPATPGGTFAQTGDEAAANAPRNLYDPAAPDNSAPAGADLSMQGQDINRPMPADPNQARTQAGTPIPAIDAEPVTGRDIPTALDALNKANASDEAFLDQAVNDAHQQSLPTAIDLANPGFTGVPDATTAERVPSVNDLQADRGFYASQQEAAATDLRNMSFDQADAQNAPPPVPVNAFTQRQTALAAEADRMRQQGHLDGTYDQAMNAPDRMAPQQAADDAVARAAGKAPDQPATPTALSAGLNAEMNRLAQRNPAKLTTSQLGTLATHHPEQAVKDAANQVLQTRRNKALVEDVNKAPENVSTVGQSGEMAGNTPTEQLRGPGSPDRGVEFSPERAGNPEIQPATGLEAAPRATDSPAAPVEAPATRSLEQTAPELKPLKQSMDAEARGRGLPESSGFIPVDRASLPTERSAADNGVKDATTLSRSDANLLDKQAAVFGKKVVLFRQEGARPGESTDGAVLKGDSKTIYVNADASGAHHLVVFGHELAHQMQTDAPKLYDTMSRAIMKQAQSGALDKFKDYYGDPGKLSDPAVRQRVTNEFIADLAGNRFSELNTWRKVFAGADKADRGLVYRIADFVTSFIDKLLGNTKFKQFATDDMVKNMKEVRQSVRQALSDYSNQAGSKAMQHEADQLRARVDNRREGTVGGQKLVEPVKAEPRADVGKPVDTRAPAPVAERTPEPTQGTARIEPTGTPRTEGVKESPQRQEPVSEPAAKPAEETRASAPVEPDARSTPAVGEGSPRASTEELFSADQKRTPELTKERTTAIRDVTEPIDAEAAGKMVEGRTEKPEGVDPAIWFKNAKEGSEYRIGDVPLDMFRANEHGASYDGTVDADRARQYALRNSDDTPPIIGVAGDRSGGIINVLDGGHRITAARLRGDDTIKAIVHMRDANAEVKPQEGGPESPLSSDPEVRRSAERSAYLGKMTPEEEAAAKSVGMLQPKETYVSKMKEFKTDFGKRLQQGLADQFAPIRDISEEGYQQSRLSKGTDGALEAAILYGVPYIRDGVYDVDVKGKGFGKIMAQLDGEHGRFFLWVAAHRAEALKAEGKENLFTTDDITALKGLDRNDAQHPQRSQKFADTLKEYNDFNDGILKIAEESGIMDPATRQLFKDQPYVPFYRVMADDAGQMAGPGGKTSGLVNQYAFKKLKGGTQQLNGDLLANVLQNWSHLLAASSRNRAADTTFKAAETMTLPGGDPIVTRLSAADMAARGSTKGTVKVLENGKPVFYEVNDPHLLTAVSAMSSQVPPWMKPLSTFKHLLTKSVTVMPGFKLRNLIRDTVSALAVGELSPNIGKNIAQGIAGTSHKSQTYASMLASGGIIRMGAMMDGNEAARTHRLIMNGVDKSTILNESGTKQLFEKAKGLFEAYQELGDKSENINRAALYQQLLAKKNADGSAKYNHAEAAFMSRDMMDFTSQGSWPVVKFLTQSVPFLNARIQGLYKLGRAGADNPARVAAVVGAVMMGSLALMATQKDDPDWKRREDWDRDNYWWFKMGSTAFRIPKPFEIGAAGTIAERTWELISDKEMTGSRYAGRVADILGQQFALNPTPQIIKPLMDVYANKDGFTGRPIESQAMQKLQSEDRYGPNTSMAARFLGSLGLPDPAQLLQGRYSALSPVQMESLLHGYFGSLGGLALGVTDAITRPLTGQPVGPSSTLSGWTGGMIDDMSNQQSRYVTTMYDNLNNIEQAYNSYHTYLKTGQLDKARTEYESNRNLIATYGMAESTKRAMSQLNNQEKRIVNSQTLSASTKRNMLDSINTRKDALAHRVSDAERERQQQ